MPVLKRIVSSRRFIVVAVVALCASVISLIVFFCPRSDVLVPLPENPLFRNSEHDTEVRITDLLSYMTLEEKIGQMALVEKNSVHDSTDIARYGLGALMSGLGAHPSTNTPEGWKTMVTDFVDESRKSRLGIPLFYGVDAIHGHSNVPEATIFPHAIGLGASGNAALVEAVAKATAAELRVTNILWSFSPMLDLPRDIRWGRTFEAFSDDPKLVSKLGVAYIKGLQHGAGTSSISVMSTPKHFIGLGSMTWGSSSNKNFKIDQGVTFPNEKALRTEYLPPFAAAVDAGVQSIMVGLNSWGETKLSAHRYLITTVLKENLGFQGFIVSDWYGVYEMAGGDYDNAVTAINAGVDMVMLPFDYKPFIKNVERAVKTGEIREERIDDAVRRILRAKFALGLFDTDSTNPPQEIVGSLQHRAIAREAVAKSLVLLKNETATLPIAVDTKLIRVVGSAADNVGQQMGGWTVEWQGIDGNWLEGGTSILAGIRARAGTATKVVYESAGNFDTHEEIADIGIAIVGEKPYAEGWGDREYPVLDSADLAAITKLQTVSKKVLVIIVSGRPLFITNEIPSWDAVVAAWLPGSEGAGVADVLFGDVSFTGTLPLPWPHHSEQLPIAANGKTADDTSVLFPRYFGLR